MWAVQSKGQKKFSAKKERDLAVLTCCFPSGRSDTQQSTLQLFTAEYRREKGGSRGPGPGVRICCICFCLCRQYRMYFGSFNVVLTTFAANGHLVYYAVLFVSLHFSLLAGPNPLPPPGSHATTPHHKPSQIAGIFSRTVESAFIHEDGKL
jgi:hypothetical protein